jgi:hypothetical protein
MSGDLKKIFKNLDDLERKVTKSNKIVQKGEKISLGDAIKLGRKSNSITSTINKGIKEYDVSISVHDNSKSKADNNRVSPQAMPTQRKSSSR